jgi:anthranilate synthase component 2
MILLIDNYDSFTYNLYQYIGTFNSDIQVIRNDQITVEEIDRMRPEQMILSPGPKAPKDAGICLEVVKRFYKEIPILGICLGHQCIGEALGAEVSYAKELLHGKQSLISHEGVSIFTGVPSPVKIARYHSLAVKEETLPQELRVLATTDDGEIMAMKHRRYPVIGVQFHPESIYTEYGKRMIENFVNSEI